MSEEEKGFGKVARVINEKEVVINKGLDDGVEEGDHFLIYELSDFEIEDPDTGENLGKLERVKGEGKVIHSQENISTIQSIERTHEPGRTIKRSRDALGILGEEKIHESGSSKIEPFKNPKVGDLVKRI